MTTSRQSHRRRKQRQRSLDPRLLARIAAVAVLALAALSSYAHYDSGRAQAAQSHPAGVQPVPTVTPTPAPTPSPAPPTHLWKMPTPLAVPPPPTLTGYVIAVTEPNTTVAGACSSGTSVQITAPHAHVTITGHCAAVVITADSVLLNVDHFDAGYISGKHVTVLYSEGTPTVHNYGAGSRVAKV